MSDYLYVDDRDRYEAQMDRSDEWIRQHDNEEIARRTGKPIRRSWPQPPLTELLDFEADHPGHPARKADAIRDTFGGMSVTSYYQHLNRVITTPEALEHNPMLVHALLNQVAERTQARTARRIRTHQ